jgi:hypothetical protein
MLTEPQITLYGKRWGAVCRANVWSQARGRLVPAADASRERSPEHRAVWVLAEQHALQQHRSVMVEDLRKGCIALITERYQSSKDLKNGQFSRLLTLFALLIDPDDLKARLDWDNPDREEHRRAVVLIKSLAPEAYVDAVAQDKFNTTFWEDLTIPQLRQFAMTLKARRATWASPSRLAPQSNPRQAGSLSHLPEPQLV